MIAMSAWFFWLMLFAALAIGFGARHFLAVVERRALHQAIDLVTEVLGYVRFAQGGLPTDLRRRLAAFRDRHV